MSRRARGGGPSISLFSFQDIITSVTAILILLVLILTLELVSRVRSRNVAGEDRAVARQLTAAVASLRERAAELAAMLAAGRRAAIHVARFSEKETTGRTAAASAAATDLEFELELLDARQRAAESEQRTVERELVEAEGDPVAVKARHAAAMDERAAEIETSNQAEADRQAEARKEIGPEQVPARLAFSPDPDSDRVPALVDVSARGLAILSADGAAITEIGWGLLGPGPRFGKWLDGLDAAREYVVLILRPSGLAHYEAVREAVVSRDVDIGVELVGEQMRVVFAERQAK
jgi:hypothetical protein